MTALTYFTPKLTIKAVVADVPTDLDTTPETQGIYGGVTITPIIAKTLTPFQSAGITTLQAADIDDGPALIILAPVDARIDLGRLALRADPDRPILSHANLAAFPDPGLTTKLYRALDTGTVYQWNGSAYVVGDDFATVRLVAETAVLGLPVGHHLVYSVAFDHVTFNGGPQQLPEFKFQAPTTDTVVDLATVARI